MSLCLGIEKSFDSLSKFPVTHGGLGHYPENPVSKLPTGYWFLIRSEQWDCDIHTDVTRWMRNPDTNESEAKAFGRPEKLAKDADDQQWEALDRLVCIMSRRPNQRSQGRRIPMTYSIDADKGCIIVFNMYHNARKLAERGPLRTANGSVRKTMTLWPFQFLEMPNLSDYGFLPQCNGGKNFYVVHAIVEVIGNDDHLDIKLSILTLGEVFHYEKDAGKWTRSQQRRYEMVPTHLKLLKKRLTYNQPLCTRRSPNSVRSQSFGTHIEATRSPMPMHVVRGSRPRLAHQSAERQENRLWLLAGSPRVLGYQPRMLPIDQFSLM